jgi:hypothetical protein
MERNTDEGPLTVEEALESAPAPTPPAPHGVPPEPVHLSPRAAELYRQAREQEEQDRAAAECRRAAEAKEAWVRREIARIAGGAKPVYDEIAAAVETAFPGFGSLARRLEIAEAEAMDQGRAVDGEIGAAEVQGLLRGHRAERLRPFLNLLRNDNPPGDRL